MKGYIVVEQVDQTLTKFYSGYVRKFGLKFWVTETVWLTFITSDHIISAYPSLSPFKWNRRITNDRQKIVDLLMARLTKKVKSTYIKTTEEL